MMSLTRSFWTVGLNILGGLLSANSMLVPLKCGLQWVAQESFLSDSHWVGSCLQVLDLRAVWGAVVLNNDGDLQGAVQQIDAIITAERHRTHRIRWHDSAPSQPSSRAAAPEKLPEMQKC